MKIFTVLMLCILLLIPTANAEFPPDLTLFEQTRFIAGWVNGNGSSIPAAGTQFFSMFGDSAPRNTETEVISQASFTYNITNFRVSANVANCGGLSAGQSFSYAVRKNGADTVLQGNCTFGAAQHSFTLDTDIVQINPGDRLTFRVTLSGAILGVAHRVGLSLEGLADQVIEQDVLEMVLMQLDTEIGQGIAMFFWLALIVSAVILAAYAKWSLGKWISLLAFIASVFWGLEIFSEHQFFQGLAAVLGFIGLVWAASVEDRKK